MKRWILHRGMPIVGYAILVGIVFSGALQPSAGMMLFGDDIHHQYYFFREFFNQWIRSGIFPWWNPYIFSGQPFIADPMVNIWYPFTWLFVLLPLNVAYSWHIAFHVFWAMLGMYILVNKVTGNKHGMNPSAWVSGVVFGLSGFFMARTWGGHVDVIAAASWMPWVVWAFWRLTVLETKRFRALVLASIIFALQLLAGYQTMAFFTVMIVGIVTLFQSVAQKSWKPILWAGIAGLLGVGLAAIQILPEQEFFRASIRTYALPYSWVSYGSWTWKSLLQLFNPFYFGNQYSYSGPPPNFIEHSVFMGVGGILLAFFALVWGVTQFVLKKKWSEVYSWLFIFIVISVFGLWISLGSSAPFDLQYLLWKVIPMYHYLRIPPRHLILVIFGLAGLAGIGFSRLPGVFRSLRLPIMGIVVVEMVLFGRHFIELRPVPEMRQNMALISLLKNDTQPYRLFQDFGVWLPQRDALEFDGVMSNRIFSANGYDTSILRNYYEYVAGASGQKGSRAILQQDVQVPYLNAISADAIDTLNIKYIMVPTLYDPFGGNARYTPVLEDAAKEYRLYENTTVKPRFYLNDPCGSVKIVSYTPNRIILSTDSTCTTTLMSSEIWYPGWTATVDGKKVSIGRSNDVFRTLFVTSGKHTIIYEYYPGIFIIGGGISFITAALLWFLRKK